MQTFPNTKICNALHENNFAQKIKNSLPCAAARLGTQSFKNQSTNKRRAHTVVCMPNEFNALHSKTNTVTTWKKVYPVYSLDIGASCATHQVQNVARPKTDQSTTLVRFEHVPRRSRGVRR